MIRTDLPGKKVLGILITVPYMIPSWTKAIAWLLITAGNSPGDRVLPSGHAQGCPRGAEIGPLCANVCDFLDSL